MQFTKSCAEYCLGHRDEEGVQELEGATCAALTYMLGPGKNFFRAVGEKTSLEVLKYANSVKKVFNDKELTSKARTAKWVHLTVNVSGDSHNKNSIWIWHYGYGSQCHGITTKTTVLCCVVCKVWNVWDIYSVCV